MRFCFDAVSRGTLAEGATLNVIRWLAKVYALIVIRRCRLRPVYDPCPACGGHPVQATGGTEMRVKELEVE
jgi:hydrogenase nickel incorporation protein HypA/HybF